MIKAQIIIAILCVALITFSLIHRWLWLQHKDVKQKLDLEESNHVGVENKLEREYSQKLSQLAPKVKDVISRIETLKEKGENSISVKNGEVDIEVLKSLVEAGYKVKFNQSQNIGLPSTITISWNAYPILTEEDIRGLNKQR